MYCKYNYFKLLMSHLIINIVTLKIIDRPKNIGQWSTWNLKFGSSVTSMESLAMHGAGEISKIVHKVFHLMCLSTNFSSNEAIRKFNKHIWVILRLNYIPGLPNTYLMSTFLCKFHKYVVKQTLINRIKKWRMANAFIGLQSLLKSRTDSWSKVDLSKWIELFIHRRKGN